MAHNKKVLILDSSQISTFLECQRMWDYNYKQSLVTIQQADNLKSNAIAMGTYGHKLLEIYYKGVGTGYLPAAMLERAMNFNPDDHECECGHLKEQHECHIMFEDPEPFNDCRECTCQGFKPIKFPLETPDRDLVKQRIREYVYTYSHNDIQPLSGDSVELGFSELLYEDNDFLFILEGRIDIIGKMGEVEFFADHKFQLRARDLYEKAIQFRNYSLVTKKLFGLINYVRLTKKVDSTTYKRAITSFTANDLLWWKDELISIFFKIQAAIDMFAIKGYYEPNWGSCSGKFGYPCNYVALCEEQNLQVRNALMNQLYTKRKEWRPW